VLGVFTAAKSHIVTIIVKHSAQGGRARLGGERGVNMIYYD
jgi:hypothetical protein